MRLGLQWLRRRAAPATPASLPEFADYMSSRRRIAEAPYDLAIYERLIRAAGKEVGVLMAPFTAVGAAPADRARLFVRHDVDTAACARGLPQMLDIDLRLGVRSGVYLRVDDDEYSAATLREAAASYRARGLEFGLHTVCYLQDDSFAAFRRESEKFADEIGFAPRSFTVHGLGARRYPERQAFQKQIVSRLNDFGYEFTDCESSPRAYSYVIEDCHLDRDTGHRFIYEDFVRLPTVLRPGREYLVLTHPCYWISR